MSGSPSCSVKMHFSVQRECFMAVKLVYMKIGRHLVNRCGLSSREGEENFLGKSLYNMYIGSKPCYTFQTLCISLSLSLGEIDS